LHPLEQEPPTFWCVPFSSFISYLCLIIFIFVCLCLYILSLSLYFIFVSIFYLCLYILSLALYFIFVSIFYLCLYKNIETKTDKNKYDQTQITNKWGKRNTPKGRGFLFQWMQPPCYSDECFVLGECNVLWTVIFYSYRLP
jgi:energy-coupling factor transporter transmembrane protein EcfT